MARMKIKTNMIKVANGRQVSFSKRRSSIFNKASELCTLCAVETAIIIFSPSGKAFTFCNSCFEAIMKKLGSSEGAESFFSQHMADHEATLRQLNNQYSHMLQELEAEKKRGEELKDRYSQMLQKIEAEKKEGKELKTNNHPGLALLKRPLDELNLNELETLKSFLEHVRAKLLKRAQEHLSNTSPESVQSIDLSVTSQKGIFADNRGDDGRN